MDLHTFLYLGQALFMAATGHMYLQVRQYAFLNRLRLALEELLLHALVKDFLVGRRVS